ncbi:hypothetical protein, partial [Corynebacterium striatum]|uniref:hypothetical protein n=1 Tax=Corynebacterium striatum TaxID=43770 RepID=UPI003B5BCD8D
PTGKPQSANSHARKQHSQTTPAEKSTPANPPARLTNYIGTPPPRIVFPDFSIFGVLSFEERNACSLNKVTSGVHSAKQNR